MKIYTRQGDEGETGLRFGFRVSKGSSRVEAYGAVDEANAAIGVAVAALPKDGGDALRALLLRIQRELFDLGAELSTPPSKLGQEPPKVTAAMVTNMEKDIDSMESGLVPLRQFILPGGGPSSSALHVARAVSRRAERRTVTLAEHEGVSPEVLRYLNRLSDCLFVAARAAAALEGMEDTRVEWGG